MTREVKLETVFPTVLGIANLGRDFSKKEMDFFNTLEMRPNSGNIISVYADILDKPEMSDLRDFCYSSINDYFHRVYKPINSVGLRITQSWVNATREGEFHHRHHHPNSALSASFYISTNEEDRIYFYNPLKQTFKIDPVEYDIFNSESWWIPAEQGTMVMFPSWLDHDVRVKTHSGTRISLSFNTFFVGSLGTEDGRTGLALT